MERGRFLWWPMWESNVCRRVEGRGSDVSFPLTQRTLILQTSTCCPGFARAANQLTAYFPPARVVGSGALEGRTEQLPEERKWEGRVPVDPPPVPPSRGPPALCSRWAIVVHLGFTATPGRRWCVPHLKNSMGHREVDQPSCRHTSVRGRADFASDRLTPGSGLAGDRAHQWTPSTLGMLLRFFLQQPSS